MTSGFQTQKVLRLAICCSILIGLVPGNCWYQVEAATTNLSPQPSALSSVFVSSPGAVLAGIQKRYSRVLTLKADFVQVYQGRNSRTVREAGTLELKKPGLMRWDYREPTTKQFISDGKKTWFYLPGEKRVTVEPVREARDPRLPFLFLLGRNDLNKEFAKLELGTDAPTKAGNISLRLWPRRRIENVAEIRVECDPQTFQLTRISVVHGTGDRSDFLLSNLVENQPLADTRFTFSPPTGVKVERFD
ncbi:MAG: outer membrane lipoprotein chaperone LolA [Blastocatellia bacterium]|nr:outer membrane lipoprotein chaperone LolA [Blastocatellia bacterium]